LVSSPSRLLFFPEDNRAVPKNVSSTPTITTAKNQGFSLDHLIPLTNSWLIYVNFFSKFFQDISKSYKK
jgi:hypothetical protein